jgi:hypothetical protein
LREALGSPLRLLCRLDLEQPDERRLVLLLERDNREDAEVLVVAWRRRRC